jgi:hypothetical protein
MANLLSISKFHRALNEDAKKDFLYLSIGESISIDVNSGIINGIIEEFIDEDLILKIGHKSVFAVNAKSILKINKNNRKKMEAEFKD